MTDWLDTLRTQYAEGRPSFSVVALNGPQTEHDVYLDHCRPIVSVAEAVSQLAAARFDVVGVFEEGRDGYALRIVAGAEAFARLLPDPAARVTARGAADATLAGRLLQQYRRVAVGAINRGTDFAHRGESRRFYRDDVARFVLDAESHLFAQSAVRVFLLIRSWLRFRDRILANDDARRTFQRWTTMGSLRAQGHGIALISSVEPEPADGTERLLSARDTLRIDVKPPDVDDVRKALLALHFGGIVSIEAPKRARYFAEKLMSEITDRGLTHLTRFTKGISDQTIASDEEYGSDDIRPLPEGATYIATQRLNKYIDFVVQLLTQKQEFIDREIARREKNGASRAEAVRAAESTYASSVRAINALLYGPPGTGKTTLVEAIATRLRGSGVPVKHVTPAVLNTEGLKDRSLQKLQQLKERWARYPACVIYFNEADSFLTKDRFAGGDAGLVNELKNLFAPPGERSNSMVFIIDTNDPEQIDDAVKSRCQTRLYIGLPTVEGIEQMITHQLKRNALRLADGFTVRDFAEMAKGRSGRDLSTFFQTALWHAQSTDAPIDSFFVRAHLPASPVSERTAIKFAREQQEWEAEWAAEHGRMTISR
ncbi:MAG TPA: AAA family ATPase [Thermoanaerobaculia bacterium]|nr:AAA family ATPase [Thermoanaerobaculia bacterium]